MPVPGTTALGEGLIGTRFPYLYCVYLFATTDTRPDTFVAGIPMPRHAGTIIGDVRGTNAARAGTTGITRALRSVLLYLISNESILAIDIQQ